MIKRGPAVNTHGVRLLIIMNFSKCCVFREKLYQPQKYLKVLLIIHLNIHLLISIY